MRRFTPEQVAEIVRLYASGLGATGIAKKFGLDPNPIKTVLRRSGVHIRGYSESKLASIAGGHHDVSGAVAAMHSAWRGQHHTAEARAAISTKHLGVKFTDEHRRKMSIAGKARGEEVYVKAAMTRERDLTNQSPAEVPYINSLIARKFTVVPQKACGRYNIDIALTDHLVAVEPYHSFVYAERDKVRYHRRIRYLAACGWLPIIIVVYKPDEDIVGAIDYVEKVARARDVNSTVDHIRVILGSGLPGTFHGVSGH